MGDFYWRFYYGLRSYLDNKHRLLRLARIVRAYVILGPLRNTFVGYYQKFSHNEPISTDKSPFFSNVDVEKLVNAIDDVGYVKLGNLPEEHVTQILTYCENSKQAEYWNPHKNFEIVDRISRNSTLVAVARKYLGVEPILWLTQLRWSFAPSDNLVKFHPSLEQKPGQYNFHNFHYDAHDFKSLTVFVYLTDVNRDSGPHMMIPRTHKNKTLKDLAHISLKDDVAEKIYPNKIRTILGRKGLVFLEDTSSYHKAAVCNKERRLLLSIDYVLRRKATPERPLLHET
jgi:hypothetical protein